MASRYCWDDFVLDLDSFRLERAGVPLPLEPKAINLLALLVARPGHLFTKQEIFEAVWPGTAVSDHALTRVVAQLRRALGEDAKEGRYLETVPTRGYRWVYPIAVATAVPARSARVLSAEPDAETNTATVAHPGRRWFGPTATVAVVLVVAMGMAAWVLSARRPVASADARTGGDWAGRLQGQFPVQLTTHPGLDLHPALSPQGDAIAFASDRSGQFEIYVRSLGDGAADVAVTSDEGQNVQPAWSPDGAAIAYHSAALGGIWVVPSRGGVARQIVSRGSSPRWSPDGRRLVYQSDEFADVTPTGFAAHVGATLMLVDVARGEPRALTHLGRPAGAHATPAWSGDSRYVAFSVFGGGDDSGLWVVRVESGEVIPIERTTRVYEAAFAEHNTALYAAAGDPIILRYGFDPDRGVGTGQRDEILVPGVPGARGLSVSSDGRHLVFGGLGLISHIWAQPVDVAGHPRGAPSALTEDTSRRNYMPAISPDGASLAYMSARRGEMPNLWLLDLATRQPRQLTDDDAFDRDPSWLPDGRRLTYRSEVSTEPSVRVIDIATRRSDPLVRLDRPPAAAQGSDAPSGALGELDVSASGRRIAFSMLAPPNAFRRLFVMDVDDGRARAVSSPGASVGYPIWSPDERSLAVEIEDGGDTHLAVVDVATGQMRQLTSDRGQVWIRSWSPDGTRVVTAVRRNRLWSLEWVDVRTAARGVVVPAGPPSVYYRYPDWSPQGTLIAYERGQMHGNIWRLALPVAP